MKNILLALLLVSAASPKSYGQIVLDTDGLGNPDNVYLYALTQYCGTLDRNTTVVYVRNDDFIGESWPRSILDIEIRYLDTFDDYKSAIRGNGGSVTVVGITPLDLRDGTFSVSVIPYSVTSKRKTIHFSNGGGLSVFFHYDPAKKGLVYKGQDWKGI